jgi:hypothetical protein
MKHQTARIWLSDGRAAALPQEMSVAFDDYLERLPWAGTTGLDWRLLRNCSTFDLRGKSPADVRDWLLGTRAGSRTHMCIFYSRAEGGIIAETRVAGEALDELYQDAPGPRFSFSATLREGIVTPFYADLVQYGNGDMLVASGVSEIPC